MREIFRLFRFGATCLAAALVSVSLLRAQPATEMPAPATTTTEKLNQTELLEANRLLREQLRAVQLTNENNRLEAEAAANARTTAITEKLESLRLAVATDRERQQIEAQRNLVEREHQQFAAQEMNQLILRVVVSFGSVGLLALFAIALLQWRGNRGMTQFTAQLPPLPVTGQPGWLPAPTEVPTGESVTLSSQRLLSTIDRMERRILELEQTVVAPAAVAPEARTIHRPSEQHSSDDTLQTARITTLLNRGRSLLNANEPAEAVACYDEILSIDANHAEALVKKGTALERLKQDQEALECYDRAIEADPNMALAYLSKGGLCVRLERLDEALECYEGALQAGKSGSLGGVARVSVSAAWPSKR